ncbi:MAG: hypothetical protein WB773_32395, partial [Isosphaeraceae bacterium]
YKVGGPSAALEPCNRDEEDRRSGGKEIGIRIIRLETNPPDMRIVQVLRKSKIRRAGIRGKLVVKEAVRQPLLEQPGHQLGIAFRRSPTPA